MYSRVNRRVKAMRSALQSYASDVASWAIGWTQCCQTVEFLAYTASMLAAMLNPIRIVIAGNRQAVI